MYWGTHLYLQRCRDWVPFWINCPVIFIQQQFHVNKDVAVLAAKAPPKFQFSITRNQSLSDSLSLSFPFLSVFLFFFYPWPLDGFQFSSGKKKHLYFIVVPLLWESLRFLMQLQTLCTFRELTSMSYMCKNSVCETKCKHTRRRHTDMPLLVA